MNTAMVTKSVERIRARVDSVPPQRKAPTLPTLQRPGPQVLQTGRAPAQLSLFLRPVLATR